MSGVFLLDVNVLIAMSWPTHVAHERVQQWFSRHGQAAWATCPFTQAAFVRILSNPAFSPNALTTADAFQLLGANLKHPGHKFWPDSIGLLEATRSFQSQIAGHQQVSDAYLLGLALHHKARLATLDTAIPALVGKGAERDVVTVI
ncbi:MAG TPA: TA system VapC family ribonuclease toxin [Candidatus Acidoferrum sp.]|nr:TA system VapC family ribonuclease toxin [Candidatus Acidoferrum sp.]